MKIPAFLSSSIDKDVREEFERGLLQENYKRGRIVAVFAIIVEAVYSAILIVSRLLGADRRFHYSVYLSLYLTMIAVNIVLLLFINYYVKSSEKPDFRAGLLKAALIVYITFMMTWGSVVSLMDQQLYGQIVAYITNTMICSVVFLLDPGLALIPFAVSLLVLAVGLPFFQPSGDTLVGHYVNLVVFVVISWLASRILYSSYCRTFTGTVLLNRSKKLLENEVEENRKITILLSQVNLQLKVLTLLDELTGIPNRRSFRDFVDRTFEGDPAAISTLSVIMLDIDFFKQFNDCYGHEAGDHALRTIAGEINAIVASPSEFAVRWGGEEFVFAAFNTAPEVIAERARSIVERVYALGIPHRVSPINGCITVSLGVSTLGVSSKTDVPQVINLADKALYQAKSCGRNCVKFLNDDSEITDDKTAAHRSLHNC